MQRPFIRPCHMNWRWVPMPMGRCRPRLQLRRTTTVLTNPRMIMATTTVMRANTIALMRHSRSRKNVFRTADDGWDNAPRQPLRRTTAACRSLLEAQLTIFLSALRVGLTPSPTCLPGQGGLPQGDAADQATKRVARIVSPPQWIRWRIFYVEKAG